MDNKAETENKIINITLLKEVQGLIGNAGQELLTKVLSLYFCFQDSDTPMWAKSIILSALGYFITPIDGLPDFTPIAGYSDDIGIVIAAMATVTMHIKEEHIKEAKVLLNKLLGQTKS